MAVVRITQDDACRGMVIVNVTVVVVALHNCHYACTDPLQ
jgi:hypothetical protein